jgi:hypothetical protein
MTHAFHTRTSSSSPPTSAAPLLPLSSDRQELRRSDPQIARSAPEPSLRASPERQPDSPSRLRESNFDWLSLGRVPVQAKLTVGAPDDTYEQEADRVAEQVMRMPDPSVQRQEEPEAEKIALEETIQAKPLSATITPLVQRQSEAADETLLPALEAEKEIGDPIQAKTLDPTVQREKEASGGEDELDEEVVQRKSSQSPEGSAAAGGSLEQRLQGSKGGGSPLPSDVLAFMNPRFGADFSGVRVHTGGEAVQMNQDLHAQAFTHGNDVYFGAGKSAANDDLTAHELTHVVQQTGAKGGTQTQAKAMTPAESIQRLCSECEDDQPIQPKLLAANPSSPPLVQRQAEEEEIQMKANQANETGLQSNKYPLTGETTGSLVSIALVDDAVVYGLIWLAVGSFIILYRSNGQEGKRRIDFGSEAPELAIQGGFSGVRLEGVASLKLAEGPTEDNLDEGAAWSFNDLGLASRYGKAGIEAIQLRVMEFSRDGIYGKSTARSVRAWQARNGLLADGIAGPATCMAMFGTEVPPTGGSLSYPSSSSFTPPSSFSVPSSNSPTFTSPVLESPPPSQSEVDQANARSFNQYFRSQYTKSEIIAIQKFVGDTAEDGIYSEMTALMVRWWQEREGFEGNDLDGNVGGRFDGKTLQAMLKRGLVLPPRVSAASSASSPSAAGQNIPKPTQTVPNRTNAPIPAQPIPVVAPISESRRYPGQTCDNSVLDRLQKEMHDVCDKIPGESCSPKKVNPKKLAKQPCSKIRERIQAMKECLHYRQRIQDECFGGVPDEVHKNALEELQSGLKHCLDLEKVNCAPGHPMANL